MRNIRFVLLALMLSAVSTLLLVLSLPAAEPASAAGAALGTVSEGASNVAARPAETETLQLDFFIYAPLMPKRWPPVPFAPQLHAIKPNAVLDASYAMTWTASDVPPDAPVTHYTLEESFSPDFSDSRSYMPDVRPGVPYTVTPPLGTYGVLYYRIRAHNGWGTSRWSNIQAVLVQTRMDHFDAPGTGWRARRTSAPDISLMQTYYIGGKLETYVRDLFDFAIFSPMLPAPQVPYSIALKTKVVHKVNEVSYGIVFGGDSGAFCNVERASAMSWDGCFTHYYRLNVIWAGNYLKFNVSRVNGHDDRGRGISTELRGYDSLVRFGWDPAGWHQWEFHIYEDGFAIYVNGRYIAWISDTTFIDEPYYGIFSSTFEYNDAHFQHDFYHVKPLDGDALTAHEDYLIE